MIRHFAFFTFLLFQALFASSQIAKSNLSANTIVVGEKFTYTLEIQCQTGDSIRFQSSKKSIYALRARQGKNAPDSMTLELLSPFKAKKEKIQGKTYWTGEFSLICFDTGYLILPPIPIQVNSKTIEFPPALLRVNLMAKNKNVDFYDIEENFATIPDPETDWIGRLKTFSLWLLLLVCLGLLFYFAFIRKKKKEMKTEAVQPLKSHEKARDALNALMKKQMWRNNQEKEHFTELSIIIRQFLNEEFNQRFEGKTSFEIQMILRKEHFSSKQLTILGLILNVSDMVKFAKSSVEEEGVQSIYLKAVEFVNETENK